MAHRTIAGLARDIALPQMSTLNAPQRIMTMLDEIRPQVFASSARGWAHGAGQRADGSDCARETFATAPDSLAGPPAWLCTVVATS